LPHLNKFVSLKSKNSFNEVLLEALLLQALLLQALLLQALQALLLLQV
jgi:hypothetical protein